MKIKFYLHPYDIPEKSHYQHNIVALAQGFTEIGLDFFANIDYWYQLDKKKFLILSAPPGYTADVHLYSTSFIRNFPITNHKLNASKINIYVDSSDGLLTEIHHRNFASFDIILKVHYNTNISYTSHTLPWAFGLAQHMIDAVDHTISDHKQYEILNNLRKGHSLRDHLIKRLPEYKKYKVDDLQTFSLSRQEIAKHTPFSYWSQTGRRYDLRYYEILNKSMFTYSFGGYLFPPILQPHLYTSFFRKSFKFRTRLNSMFGFRLYNKLYLGQFDNFRFWDCLYANTIPIHVDLKNYGCKMPVMPDNWVHYIGIENIHQLPQFVSKMEALTDSKLVSISEEGKKWVINHYSPTAVARRFMDLL